MRITRVEATPLAIPLAQEFHWAGGAQVGANLVLFTRPHRRGGDGLRRVDLQRTRARSGLRRADGAPAGRPSPGDVEAFLRSIWTEGRWKMFPQFTNLVVAGLEVACWDALGRALGVPTRTFFGGAVHDELDLLRLPPGRRPGHARSPRRRLAGEGFGVIYLKVGRGGPRRRRLRRRRCARRSARAEAPDRPERGLGPRDGGGADQAARASASTGSSSRRRPATSTASRRAPLGRRQDRRRPGCVHDGASSGRAGEGGRRTSFVQGGHDAGGLLRFRQQALLCDAHGLNVNRHAFMESEISFYANVEVGSPSRT